MTSNSMSAGTTIALMIAYCFFGAMAVLVATVTMSTLIDGGWSIVVAIFTFLIATGLALREFERLRRWRHVVDLQPIFSGYQGERVPLFSLLSLADQDGEVRGEDGKRYSLGIGDRVAFLLCDGALDHEKRPVGGTVVIRNGQPVVFSRAALANVDVIDRDDASIAAAAVDKRDYGDRLADAIAQAATGTRVKTKIVPFAAYLVLSEQRADGWTQLVSAVSTEIDGETLAALGSSMSGSVEEKGLAEHAADAATGQLYAAATGVGRDMVGDSAADLVGGANDLIGDVGWVLNPDAAMIATARGSRGRLVARLVANRLKILAQA